MSSLDQLVPPTDDQVDVLNSSKTKPEKKEGLFGEGGELGVVTYCFSWLEVLKKTQLIAQEF